MLYINILTSRLKISFLLKVDGKAEQNVEKIDFN